MNILTDLKANVTPKLFSAQITGFNLLDNVSATFFTVPAGKKFICNDLYLLITTSVTQTGTVTTQPQFRVIRGSDSSGLNNTLALRSATYAADNTDKQSAYTSKNSFANAGDTVRLAVTQQIVQGSPALYTTLTGTFLLSGYLI